MKTIIRGIKVALILSGLIHFNLLAQSGPPPLPQPMYLLDVWYFQDTNWLDAFGDPPLSHTNLTLVPTWDGNGLQVDSSNPAWLSYPFESDGYLNLSLTNGTISCWLLPNWISQSLGGTGPGVWSRIIDVGQWTSNASYGWFSLFTDPAGSNLYFSAQSNNGLETNYLTAPIAWDGTTWHQLILTYSPSNSCLFLDGALATNGPGISLPPPSEALTNGFYVLSDHTGVQQFHGQADELWIYGNQETDTNEIASNYAYYNAFANPPPHFGSFGDDSPSVPSGYFGGGGSTPSYTLPTNGLWLQITNLVNGWVYLNLINGTNSVYELLSTTDLTNWTIEQEVWPSNATVMPFTISQLSRTNLFLRAQDWTGVTENGNTTPDWWFWAHFGTVALSDTNLDSQGVNNLLYDYQNGVDPNPIRFTLNITNNYISTITTPVALAVSQGVPHYLAVLVDNTNFSSATWTTYTSNAVVNVGTNQGWHDIWIGLSALPTNSFPVWQWNRLKLELTPPVLVITNPAISTVSLPLVQVQGYSPEKLNSISYDLTNAAGVWTNLSGGISGQAYSTNTWEFTTNYFQCMDVTLTNGANLITLHATDMAGNISTTNVSIVLNYSSRTNPPAVTLYWPQNGTLICNTNYTWRGWVDDPTATVMAQAVDTNGVTNIFNAVVERDGNFWVANMPIYCTNFLTLTVTDSAGNVATTNITVSPSPLIITITTPDSNALWLPPITVTGTISDSSDYTLWVNGTQATYTGGSNWTATNVYLPVGGTALFQVRAIPNSDNGGNGSGGGGSGTNSSYTAPGNPGASAQPNDAELQVDKPPRLYVQSYQHPTDNFIENYSETYTPTNYGATGSETDTWQQQSTTSYSWTDGQGGTGSQSNYYSWSDSTTSPASYTNGIGAAWQSQQTWPASFWPNLAAGTQITNGYGYGPDVSTNIDAATITLEHCNINWPINQHWTNATGFVPGLYSGYRTGNYTRTADVQMLYQTGGKGIPGMQNLFQFTPTVTELIPDPAYANTASYQFVTRTVPSQNIQIKGETLGTDGILNTVLPNNTAQDVTPNVPGVNYHTFSLLPQSQAIRIQLNGTILSQTSVDISNFCVGQYLTFSLNLPTGAVATNYRWRFTDTFMNTVNQPCTTCSVNDTYDPSLLNSAIITNWWISGSLNGTTEIVEMFCDLVFLNGNYLQPYQMSGLFRMGRPQASIAPATTSVNIDNSWGNLSMTFGDWYPPGGSPYGPGIKFTPTVAGPAGYLGNTNLQWVQVISSMLMRSETNDGSGQWYRREGINELDAAPYPFDASFSNNITADSPRQYLTTNTQKMAYEQSNSFTMWLEFMPDGGRWVPLSQVTWGWAGTATLSGTNWVLSGASVTPPTNTDSTTFPKWSDYWENIPYVPE